MIKAAIDIDLYVIGPFITQSSEPGPWGLDACLMRNGDGRPIIPGTHIAGKLRQALEELNSAFDSGSHSQVPGQMEINRLLGGEAWGETLNSRPKQLLFDDFVMLGETPGYAIRYRIRMDPSRGAAQDQAQLMLESPFPSGEKICFVGRIEFLASDKQEAKRVFNLIETGFQWFTQMGAWHSQGFGRVSNVNLGGPIITEPDTEVITGIEALDLVIKPRAPFCVDAATPADNLFRSGEIISGSTLLGCLFEMLGGEANRNKEDGYQALRENFSLLRVRHAFPTPNDKTRPVAMPLSLVKTDMGTYDVAGLEKPCLIDGKAPKFKPDWKDDGPREDYGWPELKRELRTRTRIDSEQLRAADNDLFSLDMIRPSGCFWLTSIDAGAVPEADRPAVLEQLQRLLSLGLMGLGKTKTRAHVKVHKPGHIQPVHDSRPMLQNNGMTTITLQTDALLLPPGMLNEASGESELKTAYRKIWNELSAHLELKWYYARQALRGGEFLSRRYQRAGAAYYPWIITLAGSVFVFEVKDKAGAQAKLEKWLRAGLPLPESVCTGYNIRDNGPDQWRDCPYVPQNGWGEIAVNLSVHPAPSDTTPIELIEEASS